MSVAKFPGEPIREPLYTVKGVGVGLDKKKILL